MKLLEFRAEVVCFKSENDVLGAEVLDLIGKGQTLGVLVDRCDTSWLGNAFLQEVLFQKVGNNNMILATSQINGLRSPFY